MNPPWDRNWGNWQGQYQGAAYRTLENGILTYDSLYDPGVFDYYYMSRPGQMDPAPPEAFCAQFRLRTDQVDGAWPYDPEVGIQSDEAWGVGLAFNVTSVYSSYEQRALAYIEPGQFHEYSLWSTDMRNYQLEIDGQLAATGVFHQGVSTSWVSWGDSVQGAASLHHWDYVRFGTVSALVGDVNCDGAVNFGDINPFVEALSDPDGYQQSYPGCWPSNADINGDQSVNFGDINPFVELLTGGW
jgi:hypothetical protein